MNIQKTITVNGTELEFDFEGGIEVTNPQFRALDLGSFYPVLANDNLHVIGFYSAEFGTPAGYELSEKLGAFVAL